MESNGNTGDTWEDMRMREDIEQEVQDGLLNDTEPESGTERSDRDSDGEHDKNSEIDNTQRDSESGDQPSPKVQRRTSVRQRNSSTKNMKPPGSKQSGQKRRGRPKLSNPAEMSKDQLIKLVDQHEKEIKQLAQDLKSEVQRNKNQNKQIKDLNGKIKNLNAQLLKSNDPKTKKQVDKVNDNHRKRIKTLEDEITSLKSVIASQKSELQDKEDLVTELREESEAKTEEIMDLQDMISDEQEAKQNLVEQFVDEAQTSVEEKCFLLITDDNHIEVLGDKLPQDASWIIMNVETAQDLHKLERSDRFVSALNKAHMIVYLIGTEDIRKGAVEKKKPIDTTSMIFKTLLSSCESLSKLRDIAVCTLPPTKANGTQGTVSVLNEIMKKEMPKKGFQIIDAHVKEVKHIPRKKLVADDGIKMSDLGVGYVVDSLTKTMQEFDLEKAKMKQVSSAETVLPESAKTKSGDNTKTLPTETVQETCPMSKQKVNDENDPRQLLVHIENSYMRHVFGRGHKKLKEISDKTETSIETRKWEVGDKNQEGVMIKGPSKNVRRAVTMIENIIEDRKKRVEQNEVCWYFKQNNCSKGESCQYRHDQSSGNITSDDLAKMVKLG